MARKKIIVIITGPTGVGKTDLALAVAQATNGAIINADSGQLYVPLSIGTAKPAWQTSPVPHYFFDVLAEPTDISVIRYRTMLTTLLPSLWQHEKLPIVVGGSVFYVASLLFPPQEHTTTVTTSHVMSSAVTSDAATKNLWQQLAAIDPDRARAIHPNDTYRLKRALAIWQKTATKPSSYQPLFDPVAYPVLIIMSREREDLYHRINERVVAMFNAGWVDEVRALSPTWHPFLRRKKFIGYPEIVEYSKEGSALPQEHLIARIAQQSRNYAKRQLSFLRMLEKKVAPFVAQQQLTVHQVNATTTSVAAMVESVLTVLAKETIL